MPLYAPLIPLLIWFGPVPLASMIAQKLWPDLPPWQDVFLNECIFIIGAIVTIVVVLILARTFFARRLKGFGLGPSGLNVKTIAKDFGAACVNLLAVWPLVMAAMILTISFMKLITHQEYKMERHQELNLIIEYPELPLRILIVIVAVLVAPVLEEMLFRGLVQTTIRSLFESQLSMSGNSESNEHSGPRIWLAIVITSMFFALMHANAGHWPALFVLGVCMGYTYEKSGSLLRSIFIHMLFNATTIIATLSQ